MGEAENDLSAVWFAPNSNPAGQKLKPSIRAITEFKNAIEALGSRMGNTLALLRVADILQQAKKIEESGELVAPFLSMQKETPSNAWPPLYECTS